MVKPLSLNELISLESKTALITGAAQGIGAAIAERYAEAGARLQLVDRDQKALEAFAKKLKGTYGCEVETYDADLSESTEIVELWKEISPLPDILVNNAGIFSPQKLTDIKDASFDKTINVNTRAVLYMCREFIERKGDRGGTIVNVASIEGVKAMTYNMAVYGASKAAVLAISRALVKDYANKNWKINTLVPGGIKTPGTTKMAMNAIKKLDFSVLLTGVKFSSRLPAKSMGEPDDVARAALWLGTPISDYMNGSEVVVDGGFLSV